jgi:hypothetical protein
MEIERPSKNFTAEQKRERQGSQRTKDRTLKHQKEKSRGAERRSSALKTRRKRAIYLKLGLS